jgi:hypothetical protein
LLAGDQRRRLAVKGKLLAHNRDDHVKNFAFMMDMDGRRAWAPAYDLTFAQGPGGEHTMTVGGEGREPGRKHILGLAEKAGMAMNPPRQMPHKLLTTSNMQTKPTLFTLTKHLDRVRLPRFLQKEECP